MHSRMKRSFRFLAAVILTVTAVSVSVATQGRTTTTPPRGGGSPRTPWGDPDLQGIWSNIKEAGTPFERPRNMTATDPTDPVALAKQHEADRGSREERARFLCCIGGNMPTGAAPVHWYESLDPQKSRLWLVSDPPDGRIPPLTPEAAKRAAERKEVPEGYLARQER